MPELWLAQDTPPAFLWTTVTDGAVPADNTLRYAMALDKNGVSYELHVYPDGNHGKSTGSLEVNVEDPSLKRLSKWVDECDLFFKRYVKESI